MTTETDAQERRAWWDLTVLLLPLLIAAIIGLVAAVNAGRDDTDVVADTDAVVEDAEPAAATTVVDVVSGDGRLGTLTSLVVGAGLADTLAGEGPFTVFAPTDEALATAIDSLGDAADDPAVIEQILTYHVVPGNIDAAAAIAAGSATTVEGNDITITEDGGSVLINDTVEVIDPDLTADNGVVHVINGVLIPPSLAGPDRPDATVVDIIGGDDRLGALAGALASLGLDEVLAGDGPFTVFAPTDDALTAALEALGSDAEDPAVLEDVLLFHVVPGDLDSSAVVAESSLDTVQGESIAIDASGNTVIVDVDSEIVDPDLLGSNGVVHVIDQVMLPPSLRSTLALTASLNELVSLDPIQFDTASANIRAESQAVLDQAAEVLLSAENGDVEIQGHTDDQGGDEANQALSEARANAVRDALIERGVDADRLTAVGFGESTPIADNTTPEGRQQNRRIEFRLA